GRQIGFEQAREEILRLHGTLTLDAAEHQRRAEHHVAGRQLRRGVGIGEAAAERAAVTDRYMPDVRRGAYQQRDMLLHKLGTKQLAMPRQRAKTHASVGLRLSGELVELADVNKELRRRQPHVEAREQALPAGNRHGVAPVLRQDAIGMVEGPWPDVAEVASLHGEPGCNSGDMARLIT